MWEPYALGLSIEHDRMGQHLLTSISTWRTHTPSRRKTTPRFPSSSIIINPSRISDSSFTLAKGGGMKILRGGSPLKIGRRGRSCYSIMSRHPSHFILLVVLVTTWNLIWYQSCRSGVQVLAFIICPKVIVAPFVFTYRPHESCLLYFYAHVGLPESHVREGVDMLCGIPSASISLYF